MKKGDPWPWLKGYVAARDLELVPSRYAHQPGATGLVARQEIGRRVFNDAVQRENFVRFGTRQVLR